MTDAETIAALREQLARVTAALASAEAALLSIREVNMTPGKIDAVMQGQAAHVLANLVAQVWGDDNAKNYLEMSLQCGVQDLIVTIQRKSGKTPHEFRRTAEAERAETLAELARVTVDRDALATGNLVVQHAAAKRNEEQAKVIIEMLTLIRRCARSMDMTVERDLLRAFLAGYDKRSNPC